MKLESDRAPRDLTNPEKVEELLSRWGALPKSMIVIEYGGTGDPFFGGNADDRTLGIDGLIRLPMSKVETAEFDTIQQAHEAALKVTNRRPNTILGVAPTWN